MENKSQVCGSSSSSSYSSSSSLSSSSSSVSFDHLFGPKDSSSSSSTSGIFGTIFPPPSTVLGRDSSHSGMMGSWNNQGLPHHGKYGNPDHSTDSKGRSSCTTHKDKSSSIYQNETVEPCYFSSSIYYGGQENYSPRKNTNEPQHYFKKDGEDDDPNGNNSSGASRGNWWQGMESSGFLKINQIPFIVFIHHSIKQSLTDYSLFVQAHFITNISIQNNANLPSQYFKEYWQYDQSLHYGNKLVDS
ncbi:hypothetical protein SCA6_000246 [Theobroma cacao]